LLATSVNLPIERSYYNSETYNQRSEDANDFRWRCGFPRWAVLRFGERGIGLRERDGSELDIRTGDLGARRGFSPTTRYFCYLTRDFRRCRGASRQGVCWRAAGVEA